MRKGGFMLITAVALASLFVICAKLSDTSMISTMFDISFNTTSQYRAAPDLWLKISGGDYSHK